MPPRPSRWVAQHKGCQAAVDNVKADLTAKIDKLERLLARAYPFLTWSDEGRGVDPSLDAEFDAVVTDVEVAIQHLPDEKEY